MVNLYLECQCMSVIIDHANRHTINVLNILLSGYVLLSLSLHIAASH